MKFNQTLPHHQITPMPMCLAPDCSKMVDLLSLIILLLLPLFVGFGFGPCFERQCLFSFLVLQSYH